MESYDDTMIELIDYVQQTHKFYKREIFSEKFLLYMYTTSIVVKIY